MYAYNRNYILAEPIKNRKATTIHYAFLKFHKVLKAKGSGPKFYNIDNGSSSDLKEAMNKYEIEFLLAPTHIHRQNAEERAIITCKNHFISGLSTTDPDFAISEWDHLLSQCVITLNLLRNSRVNPALSGYPYLLGPYDFNKLHMAPPGTRVKVHDKPGNRTSWGHHGTPGCYIGPSLDHYSCMQCYMPATGILRIINTLQYIPKAFSFPKKPQDVILQQAIEDIIAIMKNPEDTSFLVVCWWIKKNDQ